MKPIYRWMIDAAIVTAILFVVIFALYGCSELVVYKDRPVDVLVPTSEPCLREADVPQPVIYPVENLIPTDSDGEIVGALLAERNQRAQTEELLRNILAACTKETPQ